MQKDSFLDKNWLLAYSKLPGPHNEAGNDTTAEQSIDTDQ